MIAKHFIGLLVIVLLLLGLCGCGEEPGAPPVQPSQPVAATPKAPVQAVEPAPEEAEIKEEYTYNPIDKRDPFASPMLRRGLPAGDAVPLTPLQKYDVTDYRVTGVIVGGPNPRAMIIAPDGKNYIVRIGTKMGRNNGSIVEISKEGIFVEETYKDFSGEVRTGIQSILLPKREGVE